ncbi:MULTISPECIES: nicotinamide riboside transporter PnuC [unclassified Legionella]|uniref:nicotinamide riboside transporter PnuC n=1 Tax=unclassified Legionella TaxID=2622702 RepID=UPI001E49F405|nr:nicotinamide riboside transporter PnuC [Legionella sp. 31fI33]MCC5016220.1 nicotinamide riboside transporter PnuC [Legionella sp. 31fI33]
MLLDLFGASVSLLSTYFFIRLDSKAWLTTLLATCLNGWLYWQKGIYADMLLEAFYFFSVCYGWYLWRLPAKGDKPFILQLSIKQWLFVGAIVGLFYTIIAKLLLTFTHSNVAVLDALTTALSLVAQGLMCYRAIATWILWFLTDVLYAYLYFQKELPFHFLLMLLYTTMAITGYLRWARRRAIESKPPQLMMTASPIP